MSRLLVLLSLSFLVLGCRATSAEADAEDVAARLDRVEHAVQAGEFADALARLERLHSARQLPPDLRAREQRLVDEAARGRFAELAGASPAELEELFESDLPQRVRARAGILAAERLLAAENRIAAYRMVKRVDDTLPGHPERVLAGDIVARAGLSLIRDERRYLLLFRYEPRGVQALEYLVVHYPLEPRCAEAYFCLSQAYERAGEFDDAVARSEDLLVYHPGSVFAPAASARLPYLRLARLRRDDYDRGELLRAYAELGAWRARHPGNELEGWVAELQADCAVRLVQSDLKLAEFYRRVDNPEGQRLHAARARALALEAGLSSAAEEAGSYLDAGAEPARAAAASSETLLGPAGSGGP